MIKLVTYYTYKSDIEIRMGHINTHQADTDFDIIITCHPSLSPTLTYNSLSTRGLLQLDQELPRSRF